MPHIKLRHNDDVLEIQVPASLLRFLRGWAKDGGHKIDHTVLSLFSHGILSLCALNDYDPDLVQKANPVLDDMVAEAPNYAHVLEVTLVKEAHTHSRN